MSANNTTKLEDKAATGFQKGEEEQLRNLGQIMAAKVVHSLICHTIRDTANPIRETETDDRLCAKIMSLSPVKHIGNVELEFDMAQATSKSSLEILKLQMSIVPSDYTIDIPIPPMKDADKLIEQTYRQIRGILNMARVYYKAFVMLNRELMQLIHDHLPHINFAELSIDTDNDTLYFDPKCPKRACVIGYYVDKDRKPLSR